MINTRPCYPAPHIFFLVGGPIITSYAIPITVCLILARGKNFNRPLLPNSMKSKISPVIALSVLAFCLIKVERGPKPPIIYSLNSFNSFLRLASKACALSLRLWPMAPRSLSCCGSFNKRLISWARSCRLSIANLLINVKEKFLTYTTIITNGFLRMSVSPSIGADLRRLRL